jgi:hypothetical protein
MKIVMIFLRVSAVIRPSILQKNKLNYSILHKFSEISYRKDCFVLHKLPTQNPELYEIINNVLLMLIEVTYVEY